MKIQSSITREGKILMKQLKRISRLKIQNSMRKKGKNTKLEREKTFVEVQGMSMVDPSIFDTAYHIIEGDWLKETTVGSGTMGPF